MENQFDSFNQYVRGITAQVAIMSKPDLRPMPYDIAKTQLAFWATKLGEENGLAQALERNDFLAFWKSLQQNRNLFHKFIRLLLDKRPEGVWWQPKND